jgi:PST family polysaccharide transporter
MQPLVSIVINNYNYGRFVRRAIESAFSQTYPNVEVIVVDDGSRDESRDIIKEFADRAILVLKENGGQASAFNAGIAQARGKFTLLLDSDDYLFPDALQACVEAFPRGYSRVYFRLHVVDENGESISSDAPATRFELVDGDALDRAKDADSVFLGPPTSGNFFDTAILRSILPVPEIEFRICADAFVLLKSCLKGPIKGLDRELGAYRIHGSNAFSQATSLFSHPRRLQAQIDNYFLTKKLLTDACIEKGLNWRPLPLHSNFWLIHLLCAGRIWNVGNLQDRGISSKVFMQMVTANLLSGPDRATKRILRALYVSLLTLMPAGLARKVLRWVDYRKFERKGGPLRSSRRFTSPAARFDRLLQRSRSMSDLRIRTIRGSGIALLAESLQFVLRLGSLFILARLLVPEEFGLISMVIAITAIAERFKDLGLALVTVQREKIGYEEVNVLFWLNAALGLLMFVLIAACARPIAAFYGDSRLVEITLAIAICFLFGGITIQHQALLRRQMAFGKIATVQLTASVLSIVVAIVLAVAGFGYWALVAREVAHSLFVALGSWVAFPWVPGRPRWQRNFKSMVFFGRDVTVFNVIWFLAHNLDQILVGRLFGASALGLYRQGINLVLAPVSHLTYPISTVAEAALSRLQSDPEKYRRYYVRLVGSVSAISMPLVMFFVVFAEEIVLIALGPRWGGATVFVRILAIAALVKPVTTTAGFVMTSCGKTQRYVWWGFLSSLALAMSLLIGALGGVTGIAWGHVGAAYLLSIPLLYVGFKGTPIRVSDFVTATMRPIAASLIMVGILAGIKASGLVSSPLGMLAVGATVAIPVFAAAWVLLPGGVVAAREQFEYVRALVKRAEE